MAKIKNEVTVKYTNKYIRNPFTIIIALAILITFSVAMIVPVEYIPLDTRYDKIQHASVFFILTCAIATCLRVNHWLIGGGLVFFAIASEIVQDFLPYRSGSLEDLYADGIGIGLACLLIELWVRIYVAFRTAR